MVDQVQTWQPHGKTHEGKIIDLNGSLKMKARWKYAEDCNKIITNSGKKIKTLL